MIKNNRTDLAAERFEKIRRILRQRPAVRVNELSEELAVSAATVRRDLATMEQRGCLLRVHGGAVCSESRLQEPLFDDKAALSTEQKKRIARASFPLIKPNDSVFLDGGSTVLALARLIADMPRITVVTNSLRVAGTLSGNGPRMILIGGEFRRLSQTFVGSLTDPLLNHLHIDKAFMGTIGLSDTEELTTTDPREAHTKRLVMEHAREVILLADSTKFGKVSFVRFGSFEDLDVIVTDKGAERAQVRKLRRKGFKVVLA